MTIFSALEDSEGVIWLGGFGILRFDPSSLLCKAFDPMEPVLESVDYKNNWSRRTRAQIINCVYEDRRRRLWFGSADGQLYVYDRKSDTWTVLNLKDVVPFSQETFATGINEDEKRQLSIGTEVNCLYQDASGQLFVGTNQGLAVLDEGAQNWTIIRSSDNLSLIGNMIRTISEDRKGRIWLGTDRGIVVLEP